MSGIRLHHPSLRSCTYTLIHEGRAVADPEGIACAVCNRRHYHKTYHLALDAVGDVVVAEEVYAHVKDAGLDELKVLGEIKKPEPQRLDLNTTTQQKLVVPRERKVRG